MTKENQPQTVCNILVTRPARFWSAKSSQHIKALYLEYNNYCITVWRRWIRLLPYSVGMPTSKVKDELKTLCFPSAVRWTTEFVLRMRY